MTEKTPKRPRDPNQLAKLMVDIATGEQDDSRPTEIDTGSAGGRARAKALPKQRRTEIAQKAASARWANNKSKAGD